MDDCRSVFSDLLSTVPYPMPLPSCCFFPVLVVKQFAFLVVKFWHTVHCVLRLQCCSSGPSCIYSWTPTHFSNVVFFHLLQNLCSGQPVSLLISQRVLGVLTLQSSESEKILVWNPLLPTNHSLPFNSRSCFQMVRVPEAGIRAWMNEQADSEADGV